MSDLESLKSAIIEKYRDIMSELGPMHVFMKECGAGYLHSFNIRALCSQYQLTDDSRYLDVVRRWCDFSIRMQGTYGDPAAYNMGYLFEAPDNRPKSWFCADTLDQALALLNTAWILEPDDPLYVEILQSVLRYDQYIQRWNLGKDGFAVGYMDGEEPAGPYHTAGTRAICYYSAMYRVFGKDIYRRRGLDILEYLLEKFDINSNYHGSPLHNRCYASDALICAYYVLSGNDDNLKERIKRKMAEEIVSWAISHQSQAGFWPHDRFGYQPGAAPPAIDVEKMGAYSWGMVLGMEIFDRHILTPDAARRAMLDRAYAWLADHLVPGDVNRWGYHGWAALSILAKYTPQTLFPFGDRITE